MKKQICPYCLFGRVTVGGQKPDSLHGDFKDCPFCNGTGNKLLIQIIPKDRPDGYGGTFGDMEGTPVGFMDATISNGKAFAVFTDIDFGAEMAAEFVRLWNINVTELPPYPEEIK